jgi:hypothetical protein
MESLLCPQGGTSKSPTFHGEGRGDSHAFLSRRAYRSLDVPETRKTTGTGGEIYLSSHFLPNNAELDVSFTTGSSDLSLA